MVVKIGEGVTNVEENDDVVGKSKNSNSSLINLSWVFEDNGRIFFVSSPQKHKLWVFIRSALVMRF